MDNLGLEFISSETLRPSSKAAAMLTALLGPIPSILHKASVLINARSQSLPPPAVSISLATSMTFAPPLPVRSRMASSSVLVKLLGPLCT